MSYDDSHRYLLRLISSQSVLSLIETQNAVNSNTGHENSNIKEMIKAINEKIKPFQQMIKIVKDEVSGKELVTFLSIGFDSTTKAQNVFSALEVEYFRILIENIMTTETREIREISALNFVNEIKVNNRRLTKMDAQKLLSIWCDMKFLEKSDNNYALGVRGIHEFESYLCTNMADTIEKCYLCSNIVFRGYNCPNCSKAVHNRCLQVFLAKAQKWPCCKQTYNHSQLQQLRGQSLNDTTRLEATQTTEINDEDTQLGMTLQDPSEEMETEEINSSTSKRGQKRKRINSYEE